MFYGDSVNEIDIKNADLTELKVADSMFNSVNTGKIDLSNMRLVELQSAKEILYSANVKGELNLSNSIIGGSDKLTDLTGAINLSSIGVFKLNNATLNRCKLTDLASWCSMKLLDISGLKLVDCTIVGLKC